MGVRFAVNNDGYTRTTGLIADPHKFSVCCWIRPSAAKLGANIFIIQDVATTGDEVVLGMAADSGTGLTQNLFNNQGAGFEALGNIMNTNSWYFVGCTVNGNVNTFYFSDSGGSNALSTANFTVVGGTPAASFTQMWIARDGTGVDNFPGDIQCLKVWDAVLSAAEMQNEVFSQRPVRTANLNAWYPLLNAGSGVKDFSGQGNNMTAGASNPTDTADPPVAWCGV